MKPPVYLPYEKTEVFGMLPVSVQNDFSLTETSNYIDKDCVNELCDLALKALRSCRMYVRYGVLTRTYSSVCIRVGDSYKMLPSIRKLAIYLDQEELFEFLRHSGIAYSERWLPHDL